MNHHTFQLGHILVPRQTDFFLLPVYEHFLNRHCHREACAANWNVDKLREDFSKETIASSVSKKTNDGGTANLAEIKLLFQPAPDLFVCLHQVETHMELQVFALTSNLAQETMESLVRQYLVQFEPKPHFNLASWNGVELELRQVFLQRSDQLDQTRLALHYGAGFDLWHDELAGQLTRRNHGLTILHGDPGTGKTTYLRHLIVSLNKTHRFTFLPLDQAHLLSELGSVDFWREQRQDDPDRKLVVIMEDAEEFLLQRDVTRGNTRAADLLNIGDGLLGDYLQLHLICTINCPLDAVDKAITRSGRLMGYRRFQRLTPSQARQIADTENLHLPDQTDYSLAEIYNGQSVFPDASQNRRVGFAIETDACEPALES